MATIIPPGSEQNLQNKIAEFEARINSAPDIKSLSEIEKELEIFKQADKQFLGLKKKRQSPQSLSAEENIEFVALAQFHEQDKFSDDDRDYAFGAIEFLIILRMVKMRIKEIDVLIESMKSLDDLKVVLNEVTALQDALAGKGVEYIEYAGYEEIWTMYESLWKDIVVDKTYHKKALDKFEALGETDSKSLEYVKVRKQMLSDIDKLARNIRIYKVKDGILQEAFKALQDKIDQDFDLNPLFDLQVALLKVGEGGIDELQAKRFEEECEVSFDALVGQSASSETLRKCLLLMEKIEQEKQKYEKESWQKNIDREFTTIREDLIVLCESNRAKISHDLGELYGRVVSFRDRLQEDIDRPIKKEGIKNIRREDTTPEYDLAKLDKTLSYFLHKYNVNDLKKRYEALKMSPFKTFFNHSHRKSEYNLKKNYAAIDGYINGLSYAVRQKNLDLIIKLTSQLHDVLSKAAAEIKDSENNAKAKKAFYTSMLDDLAEMFVTERPSEKHGPN